MLRIVSKTVVSQTSLTDLQVKFTSLQNQVLSSAGQFDPVIQSEIRYELDLQWESISSEFENYGLEAALELGYLTNSPERIIFEILSDMLDNDDKLNRGLAKQIRQYLVNMGYYIEIDPKDPNIISTGKKYDFRLNGKFYMFDHQPK